MSAPRGGQASEETGRSRGAVPGRVVRSRAPLRLGLAGGGTDVSPFSDRFGGTVLNATIDLYATTTLEPAPRGTVRIHAADLGAHHEGEATPRLSLGGKLDLHAGVYNRVVREFHGGEPLPVSITTYADVPPGSGLGSSSAMVVSMLAAFAEYLGHPLGDYDLAHLAFEIERCDLGLNGGKQDQYAATFGGINFIEFYAGDRVIVNPLRVKDWILHELESSLVLFHTGTSRRSAAIIDEQTANVAAGESRAVEAMQRLKHEAIAMKNCLLRGDLGGFGELMDRSWEAKKATARGVSNPRLDALHDLAREAGARAGKVSGAGGGGFMMFLVDPAERMAVLRALETQEGEVVPCHLTTHGTRAWRVR